MKKLNLYFSKKETTKIIIAFYFIVATYYIYIGGTTYDTMDLRFGSHKVFDKIVAFITLDFSNEIFNNFTSTEYFGLVLIFPAYLIAHLVNFVSYDLVKNIFITNDAYIYFIMHFCLIFYVIISIYFVTKLMKKEYSSLKINLFIFFLLINPSFFGHSLFNFKDIPYALQLLIVNLYLINTYFDFSVRDISRKRILISSILIALSASIRINAYLFILFTLFFISIIKIINRKFNLLLLIELFTSLVISIFILLILSPQGWMRPISFFKQSLNHQFFHGWPGSTLTNGKYEIAQNLSDSYLIDWFLARLPLNLIFGFFLIIFLILLKKASFNVYTNFSIALILSVFLLFKLFTPTAYDGLRHFIFLIPYFIIVFTDLLDFIYKMNYKYYLITIGFIFLYSFFTSFGLSSYRYTYFNESVNISKAAFFCSEKIDGCGLWPTDYWGFKGKEIANYINMEYENKIFDSKLMVCKPKHTIIPYLNKKIVLTSIDDLKPFDSVYIVTYQRPRYQEDSCNFYKYNLSRKCTLVKEFTQRIRFSRISLAYISKCEIG